MFWGTRYPMISKTGSGRVGYRKKFRVAGRVQVPAGHWIEPYLRWWSPGLIFCDDDSDLAKSGGCFFGILKEQFAFNFNRSRFVRSANATKACHEMG